MRSNKRGGIAWIAECLIAELTTVKVKNAIMHAFEILILYIVQFAQDNLWKVCSHDNSSRAQ